VSDVFISYARSTAAQANAAAEALRGLGYSVWLDDELLAHHAYTHAIEEQLTAAKAALVIWSAEAVKSEWVLSEANRAREDHKLVQLTVDGARLPMPFDQTQCADLAGWTGDTNASGWLKVTASIAEMIGATTVAAAPGPALALPSKPSIAVMPFANLSGDPEQDYFADGMVVEIVEALSRIRSIFVIASGSGLSFKGKGIGAQEAARQLGVRYVLEGSVRKSANRVRIGVQLIDATDGAQIWTHRFEDVLEDVFDLQDKVALAAAGRIEPTVQQADTRRAAARPTDNMGSYDLYLRALLLQRTFVGENVREALDLANRAMALDPDYGPALVLAAHCHRLLIVYGWSDDPAADTRRGSDLTRRALKAAGEDATVLASVANSLAYFERDYEAARAVLDRALGLNPGCAYAWFCSGIVRTRSADEEHAIADLETALRLDPVGPIRPQILGFMGQVRFQQARFGEAVGFFKELVQHRDTPMGQAFLAAAHGHLGQASEARAALARYHSLSPQSFEAYAAFALVGPVRIKLFLDGIAMAEGKLPLGAVAGATP